MRKETCGSTMPIRKHFQNLAEVEPSYQDMPYKKNVKSGPKCHKEGVDQFAAEEEGPASRDEAYSTLCFSLARNQQKEKCLQVGISIKGRE